MVRIVKEHRGVEKGKVYGKWKVIGHPFSIGTHKLRVVVECSCGAIVAIDCGSLVNKQSHQCYTCGRRQGATIHGWLVNGSHERLYDIRHGMLSRCRNKKSAGYKDYGGRGIAVCTEWEESYSAFREWAISSGYRDGLQIDRINNDGNYEPGNCRWVTAKINQRNKRTTRLVTAFGETKCIAEWVEDSRSRVGAASIGVRLRKGWNPEAAITTPPTNRGQLCVY